MREDRLLADVLRRFIAHNLNDHGYVGLQDGEVILDGRIRVTVEESEALIRAGLLNSN